MLWYFIHLIKKTLQLDIMKKILFILIFIFLNSCSNMNEKMDKEIKIIFLHHSTGQLVWNGKNQSLNRRIVNKLSLTHQKKGQVKKLIEKYNKKKNTQYLIEKRIFPKKEVYGWNNYPFDYYNIWVVHAGEKPYKEEPTLEILTKEYDIIILKHCFPVSKIKEDTGNPDINSEEKRIENYKLQYEALKNKMKEFYNTKFILWTGPALVEKSTTPDEARRAEKFSMWVRDEWNDSDDNIFIWDFRTIETNGGLYLPDEYSIRLGDSHPNDKVTNIASKLLVNRIIDVIESNGTKTDKLGNKI